MFESRWKWAVKSKVKDEMRVEIFLTFCIHFMVLPRRSWCHRTFLKAISWKARNNRQKKSHSPMRAWQEAFLLHIQRYHSSGRLRGLFSVRQIMENQNSKDSILSWSLWLLMKECMDNLIQKALITLTDLNSHASERDWNETFCVWKKRVLTKRCLAVAFPLWCESTMNTQGALTGKSQCSR